MLFLISCSQYQIDPKKYGQSCEVARICDSVIGINCNSEIDGPYYYVNKNSGEILSKCGGYCLTADQEQIKICQTKCPAEEWNCQ